MEFIISQNSTLSKLRIEVTKDGRSDYDRLSNLSNTSNVTLDLINTDNGLVYLSNLTCSVVSEINPLNSSETLYFIEYQFSKNQTSQVGTYEIIVTIVDSQGTVKLDLSGKNYLTIQDSFSLDGYSPVTGPTTDQPCSAIKAPNGSAVAFAAANASALTLEVTPKAACCAANCSAAAAAC